MTRRKKPKREKKPHVYMLRTDNGLNIEVHDGLAFDFGFFDAMRKEEKGKDYEIVLKWKHPPMMEGVIFNYGDKEPNP
jgi:hypothetical protein